MNDDQKARDWTKKAALATVLLLLAIVVTLMNFVPSCSVAPKKKVIVSPPLPTGGCEGGLAVGDTQDEDCPAGQEGQRLLVCTVRGLERKVDTCAEPGTGGGGNNCVSYQTGVSALLDENCVSCHRQLKDYDTAKSWSAKIVARTSKQPGDRDIMPPAPATLSAAQQGLLRAWNDQGAKLNCDAGNGGGGRAKFVDFDYIEANQLAAVNKADVTKQPETRWLVSSHKLNEGAVVEILNTYAEAANKALNSVNVRSGQLYKPVAIDPEKTIWQFNLDDFGLNRDKWAAIEAADKVKIVSNTNVGRLLRDVTKTNTPWLHVDNFVDITQRNADVYYKLTETPATLNQLLAKLGVEAAQDLRDLDALLAGGNKSPISLQKNRLIARFDSDDGYFWISFDPDDRGGAARNLFQNPLLKDAGGQRNFTFDASEVIYTLKNGLQAYALFNAAGALQKVAPLNVVADNKPGPLGPEIKNAISCHKCHAQGIIPMQDQIRNHVELNAAQFLADADIVRGLYEPQPVLDQAFKADQDRFQKALEAAGVRPLADDALNAVEDRLQFDWSAVQLASFLFLQVAELEQCVNRSAVAKAEIGQVLTGGTVTFAQVVATLPTLIKDCRLFQEPLD